MSNKEQTAVDWLFKQLWDEPKDKFTWYAILKQAKTMHEEEIEIAFAKSYLIGIEGISYDDVNKASAKYYKETFGKDE